MATKRIDEVHRIFQSFHDRRSGSFWLAMVPILSGFLGLFAVTSSDFSNVKDVEGGSTVSSCLVFERLLVVLLTPSFEYGFVFLLHFLTDL